MKSFGKRNDNLEYRSRNGAYAVIQNESGQFLCVEDQDRNLYLIGGGIEADETPEEALIRESVEETGYKINIVKKIGKAEKHWVSEKYPKYSQHNVATVYDCQLLDKISEPIEKEKMKWVNYESLANFLFHEHHLYLVNQLLVSKKII